VDRPAAFEQVPRGRATLLTGGADDQDRSLVICHTTLPMFVSDEWLPSSE
jgi:hypothetical protein